MPKIEYYKKVSGDIPILLRFNPGWFITLFQQKHEIRVIRTAFKPLLELFL